MQSGLDKLVKNLSADHQINTRRYLEVVEVAKTVDSGDGNVSSDEKKWTVTMRCSSTTALCPTAMCPN